MVNLIKREISSFFSSLSGYVVISVFLISTGIFLWLIPGESNIIESGYADLSPFFNIAPMLYLFLIPAICMKLFSEEKKSGTLELLLTRPVSNIKIVLSKYFAAFIMVIMSLIPTVIYAYSVYNLSSPIGSIDTGLIWGSYIALIFLATIYIAVSLFTSSLSNNQIVSFISGMALCFLMYTGIDFISTIPALAEWENEISFMGINSHYEPMARGIIDSRDISWFVIVSAIFIFLTNKNISKRL
jgi:ABC-2 type transport system permease protein